MKCIPKNSSFATDCPLYKEKMGIKPLNSPIRTQLLTNKETVLGTKTG